MKRKFGKALVGVMAAATVWSTVPGLPAFQGSVSVTEAAGVKISAKQLTLLKGERKTLSVKGSKKKVNWSSNNKQVAAVDKKGRVKGKKPGQAVITAKVGAKKYTCKVTVENPSISDKKLVLVKGEDYQLKVTGTKRKVSWSSSKSSVASVSVKGKVKAKNKGEAVITAKVGSKKYNCKVTVKQATEIKTGSIKGTIRNALNVLDQNAQIILIAEDGRADRLRVSSPADWGKATGGLTKYGVYGAKTNGKGSYQIEDVPLGDYTCVIISSYNAELMDIDDVELFDEYFEEILDQASIESLRAYIRGRDYVIYDELEIERGVLEVEENFSDYLEGVGVDEDEE